MVPLPIVVIARSANEVPPKAIAQRESEKLSGQRSAGEIRGKRDEPLELRVRGEIETAG